jgi:hypothetical protein
MDVGNAVELSRLLRQRGERPRDRRANQAANKFATPHAPPDGSTNGRKLHRRPECHPSHPMNGRECDTVSDLMEPWGAGVEEPFSYARWFMSSLSISKHSSQCLSLRQPRLAFRLSSRVRLSPIACYSSRSAAALGTEGSGRFQQYLRYPVGHVHHWMMTARQFEGDPRWI